MGKTNIFAKDDVAFFVALCEALERRDNRVLTQARAVVQAFVGEPVAIVRRKVQAITGVSTDFAKLVSDAFSVTIGATNYDLGWQRAFKEVPLGEFQDTWDIYDVQNNLVFQLIPEGNRIQVDNPSGTVVTSHVDYYGGALGWTDKMIRFRKVAAMLDMAQIFRNQFWANKANNHYLLLAAAAAVAGQTTAYQGVVADGQLRRDIQTINRAAYDLTFRLRNKGYGDTATAPLVMYFNPLDEARVRAAMAATTAVMQATTGVAVAVLRNISLIPTYNANIVANRPILVLPGQKIQMAEALPPTTFVVPKDPLTLNEVQAVWSIYGAAIGDTEQAQTMLLV
jgi:hypothetical protein